MRNLLFLFSFCLLTHCVFAQDSVLVHVSNITIEGNRKTKPEIILRELTFQVGDSLSEAVLRSVVERSRQNIFNLKLFNFVNAEIENTSDSTVEVNFTVTERWYIWPAPIFEYVDPNLNTWLETGDIRRVNIGFILNHDNFRGLNEKLRVKAKFGYNDAVELSYSKPFINKAKTIGAGFSIGYQQQYEVNYGVEDNSRLLYSKPGKVIRSLALVNTEVFYRPKQYLKTYALPIYRSVTVADSVLSYREDYLPNKENSLQYFGFKLGAVYDKRNRGAYPTSGGQIRSELYKPSLGIFEKDVSQTLIFNTTINKYFPIADRLSLGLQLKYVKTWSNQQAYLWQQSLGYSNEIRGYEYYILDGDELYNLKTNLNFAIVKPKNFNIGFIKDERFSKLFLGLNLNLYYDGAYANNKYNLYNNPLLNSWQYGYGVGFDITSYYDKVMRFDFSWNKQGDFGFFLHFTKPL